MLTSEEIFTIATPTDRPGTNVTLKVLPLVQRVSSTVKTYRSWAQQNRSLLCALSSLTFHLHLLITKTIAPRCLYVPRSGWGPHMLCGSLAEKLVITPSGFNVALYFVTMHLSPASVEYSHKAQTFDAKSETSHPPGKGWLSKVSLNNHPDTTTTREWGPVWL